MSERGSQCGGRSYIRRKKKRNSQSQSDISEIGKGADHSSLISRSYSQVYEHQNKKLPRNIKKLQKVFFPTDGRRDRKDKGPIKINLSQPPNVASNIYRKRQINLLQSRDRKEKGRLMTYEKKLNNFAKSKYSRRDAGSSFGPLSKLIQRQLARGHLTKEEATKKLNMGLKGMMLNKHKPRVVQPFRPDGKFVTDQHYISFL